MFKKLKTNKMLRTYEMSVRTEQTELSSHSTTGEKEATFHGVPLVEDLCPQLLHVSGRIIQPRTQKTTFIRLQKIRNNNVSSGSL